MVNFVDALSPETVEKAEAKAQEAFLQMVEANQYSIPEEWFNVSRPLMYAIWLHMWKTAEPQPDGTRRSKMSVSDALRAVTDTFLNDKKNNQLASAISRLMVQNGILPPGHSRRKIINPWREPKYFPYHTSGKPDVVIEKRIHEESDKPVKVYFDITQIPAPEPNPQSVLEYLKKLRASYNKLQERYDEIVLANELLEEEVKSLRSKLEGGEWDQVVEFIKGQ